VQFGHPRAAENSKILQPACPLCAGCHPGHAAVEKDGLVHSRPPGNYHELIGLVQEPGVNISRPSVNLSPGLIASLGDPNLHGWPQLAHVTFKIKSIVNFV
jgi:hypothetical protein